MCLCPTCQHVIGDPTQAKAVKMKESSGVALADLTAAAPRMDLSSFSRKNVVLIKKHGSNHHNRVIKAAHLNDQYRI